MELLFKDNLRRKQKMFCMSSAQTQRLTVSIYAPNYSTQKENFFPYCIQSYDDCIYCDKKDSVNHTFSNCVFEKKSFHKRLSVGSM